MSKSNATENKMLLLIFNNTNWANVGDATGLRGSTAAGNLYMALHTADPGEAGEALTSEAAYTGYARVAIPRTTGGFTVTGNAVTNAAAINFAQCTGGTATVTHWSIVLLSSGSAEILYKGAFSNPSSLAISNGIAATINAGSLSITED